MNISYDFNKYKFPDEWIKIKLKDIFDLVERPINMEDNTEYQLVTVKRNYGGVQEREVLKGKDILVKTQFIINEGDFLISKRQIAHGACGIVPKVLHNSIVSNEYNVFKASEKLNLNFFNYYTQLPFMKRYFYISSDGVHIEKLLFKTNDWLNRYVVIPTLKEQEKIVKILSTWDLAIEKQEQLIEKKKEFKKGLMQKLLSGEVRYNGFEEQWNIKPFEKCLKVVSSKVKSIQNKMYQDNGKYPIIDQGKNLIAGFSDDHYKVIQNDGIIIFGDHTRVIKYYDSDFIQGANGTQLLMSIDNKIYNTKFFYYSLLNKQIPNTGYNRHLKFVKEFTFVVPSLKEQNKIVEVFSTVDKEIQLLEKESEALKLQKKGLMQRLLTGEVRVKVN